MRLCRSNSRASRTSPRADLLRRRGPRRTPQQRHGGSGGGDLLATGGHRILERAAASSPRHQAGKRRTGPGDARKRRPRRGPIGIGGLIDTSGRGGSSAGSPGRSGSTGLCRSGRRGTGGGPEACALQNLDYRTPTAAGGSRSTLAHGKSLRTWMHRRTCSESFAAWRRAEHGAVEPETLRRHKRVHRGGCSAASAWIGLHVPVGRSQLAADMVPFAGLGASSDQFNGACEHWWRRISCACWREAAWTEVRDDPDRAAAVTVENPPSYKICWCGFFRGIKDADPHSTVFAP